MESQTEMTPDERPEERMSPEEPLEEVFEPVEEAIIEPPVVEEIHAEQVVVEPPVIEEIPMEEPPPTFLPPPVPPASPYMAQDSDDRTWAMLSHLSVLLNLITGILGPIVAFIIYLVYKDRSKYIAYQSMQSFVFQLICWVGAGLVIAGIWIVTAVLSVVIVGLLCIPFSLILTVVLLALPLISLVYGVVAAIETSQGKDFRYLWVGDWVRNTLEQ